MTQHAGTRGRETHRRTEKNAKNDNRFGGDPLLVPGKESGSLTQIIQLLRTSQADRPPRKMDLGEYVEPGSTLTVIVQKFRKTRLS